MRLIAIPLICATLLLGGWTAFDWSEVAAVATSGVPWTPADLTGRVLWFDGSDTNYMSVSAGVVNSWTDRISGVVATTTASAATRPTLTNTVSGMALRFWDNQALYYPTESNDAAVANARAVAAVIRAQTAEEWSDRTVFALSTWINYGGVNNSTRGHSYFVTPSYLWYFHTAAGSQRSTPGVTNQQYAVVVAVKTSGTGQGLLTHTRDGTVQDLALNESLGGTNPLANGYTAICRLGNVYSRTFVYDVIYAPSALSESDRQKLEGFLHHLRGLAGNLPADHPYKTAPPTK
jgi:hypothetical protein